MKLTNVQQIQCQTKSEMGVTHRRVNVRWNDDRYLSVGLSCFLLLQRVNGVSPSAPILQMTWGMHCRHQGTHFSWNYKNIALTSGFSAQSVKSPSLPSRPASSTSSFMKTSCCWADVHGPADLESFASRSITSCVNKMTLFLLPSKNLSH